MVEVASATFTDIIEENASQGKIPTKIPTNDRLSEADFIFFPASEKTLFGNSFFCKLIFESLGMFIHRLISQCEGPPVDGNLIT